MSSTDYSGQFLQEHDCAPPLMSEKNTDDEYTSEDSPTESSEMDGEDGVDEDGVTELMKAARRNDVDAVKRYIPQQAGMVAKFFRARMVDIHGGTALMVAAVLGHAEVVKLLMKHESRMRSSNEYTALMWATANERIEVVRLLLDAEGCMERDRGFTALTIAAYFGCLDCVKVLLEKEKYISSRSALCVADMNGHPEVVSLLKSEGVGLEEPRLRMPPRKPVSERA
ncbi:Ankyrin repeat protein 1 [Giardia duodenalis]|uniref:Ankyrin repeat protein 1 n=1 Tax=Giardia intestinalis (strain ATCC 50803 / WB clone C6) TaxID=184922 RepID=A0A644F5R4_GIAIC|nr:Ankyrin repeat protein 1 [Giardia intestinalis]KAE8303969.1 Ankyrin repeat protein 1 [Giardia intestinalis]